MGRPLKIGLIDVDGHNFPNLALMKISAYHKAKGDTITILCIKAKCLMKHTRPTLVGYRRLTR